MRIQVSAKLLTFPRVCVCCGVADPSGQLEVAASRTTGRRVIRTDTRSWNVPCCIACCAHAREWPAEWGIGIWMLVLVTGGLWLIIQTISDRLARARATALLTPSCACPGPAASFLGWQGNMKTFDFVSPAYRLAFARMNEKALVNVEPALADRMRAEAAEEARSAAAAAESKREASEEALVASILADIERGRGPAARRASTEKGLAKIKRQDLREHIVREAARIEVRAVMDKVEALKSKPAKRRHIEDALEALRNDAVADELQAKEIALLEEALRDLA